MKSNSNKIKNLAKLKSTLSSIVAGSYYSPGSYAKSINCEDSDLEEENLGEEENCLSGSKNSKVSCNKKNVNCGNTATILQSSLNGASFEFTGGNQLFPVQTNFSNPEMATGTPPIVAVAQAITSSNDILTTTTNCSAPLSKSNPPNNLTGPANPSNGLEFTNSSSTNNTMTHIDKLYSMQSNYFSASDCGENCVATN